MSVAPFTEYINKKMNIDELTAERKRLLKLISNLRGGRDLFVYAADINKSDLPNSIINDDVLPISDLLSTLSGNAVDIILETGGGSAEATEDIVKMVRAKYDDVAFIIPGTAKSAGTIMAMSGNDILMEPLSSLGPIDAQIRFKGEVISGDALIEGLEKIKEEIIKKGSMNQALYPILQNITPGDLQHADNAMAIAKTLVTEWLTNYKFKNWNTHKSSGKSVMQEEKETRAKQIAEKLSQHNHWKTHNRSIKIDDFEKMKLKITNFQENDKLYDAIHRYYIVLRMTFDFGIFKIFETATAQILRQDNRLKPEEQNVKIAPSVGKLTLDCLKCKKKSTLQLNLGKKFPPQNGLPQYPKNDIFQCPQCGASSSIAAERKKIEERSGQPVIID